MERYQQAIGIIRFINENYLEGIANSTGIESTQKQFILSAMSNFDINIREENFLANKIKLTEQYIKKYRRRPEETLAREEIVHALDVTNLIIIIYKLTNFATNTTEDFVDVGDTNITDAFFEDNQISEFLKLYLVIYQRIKLEKYTLGYSDARICLNLKEYYNGISCNQFDRFMNAANIILRLFSIQRRNQWEHKYLKYKKKYLDIKNLKK